MDIKNIIAFQGSKGSNSYIACRKFYSNHIAKCYENFSDVFLAVETQEVEYGMIPLENSYAGRVAEIHNLLQSSNISIVAEHFFYVNHCLAAIEESRLEDIKEVFSHPQALMQCSQNLKKLNIASKEYSNTAKAAEFISLTQDKTKAAICSYEAAKINNLQILQDNFQDSKDNITIFIVIAKHQGKIVGKNEEIITTILFSLKNVSGALYKALGCFAENNVNLIKLESYIQGGISDCAKFFISVSGSANSASVSKALKDLELVSESIKIVGVYFADKARIDNI